MGIEENKDVVRRQFEYLNAGNVEGAAALWSPEAFNHGRRVDPVSMSKVYESLKSLQERHTLHEIVAEGNWVTVRTTCSGIHAASPKIPVNAGSLERGPYWTALPGSTHPHVQSHRRLDRGSLGKSG